MYSIVEDSTMDQAANELPQSRHSFQLQPPLGARAQKDRAAVLLHGRSTRIKWRKQT